MSHFCRLSVTARPWCEVLSRSVGVFLLALSLSAPAGAARWYENYGKATKLLDNGGCQPGAIALLEEAVSQRKDSQRSARTVSVQVIEYYPYYQLARAQAACGNFAAARDYLSQERGFGEAPGNLLDGLAAEIAAKSSAYTPPAPPPTQPARPVVSEPLRASSPSPQVPETSSMGASLPKETSQPPSSTPASQSYSWTPPQAQPSSPAPAAAPNRTVTAPPSSPPTSAAPSQVAATSTAAPAVVTASASGATPSSSASPQQRQAMERQILSARATMSRAAAGPGDDARVAEATRLARNALARAEALAPTASGQEVERRTLELEAATDNLAATRAAAVARTTPQQVSVLIDTNVPGARVFVNGRQVAVTSDPAAIAKITLDLGSEVEVRATRDGFRDAVQRLKPSAGQEPAHLLLSPLPAAEPFPWLAIAMAALALLIVGGAVMLTIVMARRGEPEPMDLGSAPVGPVAFDRYQIRNPIGRGGIATIYRAVDTSDRREVALKILDPKWLADPEMVHKFLSEAEALSSIRKRDPQASVPEVYRSGREGDRVTGSPYIALELINGENLETFLKSRGKLSEYETTGLALQVARTLMGVHEAGIVHRDLTPDNLLLCPEPARIQGLSLERIPRLVVIDFGVARQEFLGRVTMDGSIAGKPPFMSPEQCRGARVDARSDLYALGLLIYNMIAGHPPFTGSNPFDVMRAQESQAPPPLDGRCSAALSGLILELLQKSPNDRPPSAVIVTSRLASHVQSIHSAAHTAGATT